MRLRLFLSALAALLALAAPACTPAPCCNDDSECPGGACAFGRCTVPCADDADCAPGDVCARPDDGRGDRGFCRALAPDTCDALEGAPADAGPPPVVPPDGGPPPPPRDAGPPPGCAPDRHEPNQTPSAATTDFSPGEALTLCAGDLDVFRLSTTPGQQILARIFFSQADGDLDLQLSDPQGALLAESDSDTDDESILFTAPGGPLFLTVRGALPFDAAPYTLFIELRDPPPPVDGGPEVDAGPAPDGGPGVCVDDGFEENDALPQAASVAFPVSALTCGDDEDWYRIPVPAAGRVQIRLNSLDHDFSLFDLNAGLIGQGAATDAGEFLEVERPAGELRVVVRAKASAPERAAYTLRVEVIPVDQCLDPFEPNDVTSAATTNFSPPFGAAICVAGDEDHYALQATAGDRLFARIRFDHDVGDLDMSLIRPGGNALGLSQGTADTEELLRVAPVTGTYFLRVFGFGGATGPYTVEEFRADAELCVDDEFEENDNRFDAELISAGARDATLCPVDPDFYSFVAPALTEVSLRLISAPNTDVRLRAVRPGQGVVGESQTGSGQEQITFISQQEGAVFVIVDGSPPSVGLPYRLELDLASAGCADDAFEDNDGFAQQVSRPVGATDAVACQGDPDFFLYDLNRPSLTVQLTTPGAAATATLVHLPPPPAQPELIGFVQANAGPTTFQTGNRAVSVVVGAAADTPYTLRVQ